MNRQHPNARAPFPALTALLALLLAGGAGAGGHALYAAWSARAAVPGPSAEELRAIALGYVCPMHPQITADHAGKCPICGMDLVRAGTPVHRHGLQVGAAALANLGVRTVAVERRDVGREVRAFGTVVADASAQVDITPKYSGWIRRLRVHSVGERVERGQVLYDVYSPELVAKEREYFQFRTRRRQILQSVGDVSQQENEYVMDLLRDSQKEREELMRNDLDIETIQRLEQFGTTIEVIAVRAPVGGVVTQLNVREGGFVSPAAPVLVLADPATTWVDIPLSGAQAAMVRPGDAVLVRAGDGEPIEARLDFLNPVVDAFRVHGRAILRRIPGAPPLGTPVDVTIRSAVHAARVVPSAAVVRTGHGDFVMLARDGGAFVPVTVVLGAESGDMIEIRGGIQDGAAVASNAQFLLDPAASIGDTLARSQDATGGGALASRSMQ